MGIGSYFREKRAANSRLRNIRKRFVFELLEPRVLLAADFGGEQVIIANAREAWDVYAVDLDGDGDQDVISASVNDNTITWAENDGFQNFTRHDITTIFSGAVAVVASDVDGDGDLDVVGAAQFGNTVDWFENDGNQNFTQRYAGPATGPRSIFVADVDADGDQDFLSASNVDNTISWYENDGSQNFILHNIDNAAVNAEDVFAADLDSDGDMDVLSAAFGSNEIAWYENDGNENFTKRSVSTFAQGATEVVAIDVEGDGDLDILSASYVDNSIRWYENDGAENFSERVVSSTAFGATSVTGADIDGDGDLDLVSSSFGSNEVTWYENDGSQNFAAALISQSAGNVNQVFLSDLDSDGDLDVLGALALGDRITWYEHLRPDDGIADFGDAPVPYPTTLAEDGANHFAAGPTLGVTRDTESDGFHSANATGDGIDEDGVTFGPIQVGGLRQSVTVEVFGGEARLDAWIDFNQDGYWGGPGEQIFASVDVGPGVNLLTFDATSYALEGQTFARFRLSTSGGLAATGPASDGEVEDYAVTVEGPSESNGTYSFANVISVTALGAWDVVSADMDADGDLDVLRASQTGSEIAWYENDGNENFVEHAIANFLTGATSILAMDLDQDGDIDVVGGSSNSSSIEWYENDGNQNFTARFLSASVSRPRDLFSADVDGDGDLDLLVASNLDSTIGWLENDGFENFAFNVIDAFALEAESVFASDMDGDGDLDVLSNSFSSNSLRWYENDGSQGFLRNDIDSEEDGGTGVFAVDLDGDGDQDVLSSAFISDSIQWYENTGGQNFTSHVISTSALGATSVFAADMDGDGDLDVLSSSYVADKITWYENDGNENFTAVDIDAATDGANRVFVGDVDGDGDLDVLSASAGANTVAWYENNDDNIGDGPFDFGDAPFPFPTTLAEDGARHVATGLQLGPTRESEEDGMHSDSFQPGPDEDGIQPNFMQVGSFASQVLILVEGGDGKLDAWADFNGDGSWGGADEQIFTSVDVVEGQNFLDFPIPATAKIGFAAFRFRLSSAGSLGVTGAAADGEVEDYLFYLSSPRETTGVFGVQNIVSDVGFATRVVAADINGDSRMDVISTSLQSNSVIWHEKQFDGSYFPHVLSDSSNDATDVLAVDLDRDGDLDVISDSGLTDRIEWFENNGDETFTTHGLPNALSNVSKLFAADMDGDNDIDILASSRIDNLVVWYENDGNQTFTERPISSVGFGPVDVVAADVDRDGDMDVIGALRDDDTVAWYENDGDENFTKHSVDDFTDDVRSVFAADVDDDGDMDILSASFNDDMIAWHENNGNQNFTRRVISTNGNGATSVTAADIDGDGDMDVVGGWYLDGRVAWYENNGNQSFSSHTITTQSSGTNSVFVADVDRDRDIDVLSASADGKIAWYGQNQNPFFVSPSSVDVAENTQAVQTVRAWDWDLPDEEVTYAVAGTGEDNDKFELVNGDELQFKVAPDFENPNDLGGTAGDNVYRVSVRANDPTDGVDFRTITVTVTDVSEYSVVTRRIFYNDSSFDLGTNVEASAIDKVPLLNGQIASFENYTSSSKGITGIAITVSGLAEVPTLATVSDFLAFKVGNNDTPDIWADAILPSALIYEENIDPDGSDQIILTWNDNAIEKTWLQIKVLANSTSGIPTDDTFYFGNVPGETGNDPASAVVNLADVAGTRANQTGFGSADIDNAYDFDRDGRVNLVDVALARSNQSGFSPVRLIDLTDVSGRGVNGGKGLAADGGGNGFAFEFRGGDAGEGQNRLDAGLDRLLDLNTDPMVGFLATDGKDSKVGVASNPAYANEVGELMLVGDSFEFDLSEQEVIERPDTDDQQPKMDRLVESLVDSSKKL